MSTAEHTAQSASPKISPRAHGAAANPKQWFQKGYDPRRKPRGPNKIPEAFFKDLLAVWEKHGQECCRRAIDLDPVAVMWIVARLMPWGRDLEELESELATRDDAVVVLCATIDVDEQARFQPEQTTSQYSQKISPIRSTLAANEL